eukprot:112555-Prorocentrum_minimum.AAC.6
MGDKGGISPHLQDELFARWVSLLSMRMYAGVRYWREQHGSYFLESHCSVEKPRAVPVGCRLGAFVPCGDAEEYTREISSLVTRYDQLATDAVRALWVRWFLYWERNPFRSCRGAHNRSG